MSVAGETRQTGLHPSRVQLTSSCRQQIIDHAVGALSEECCGALLGRDQPGGLREILHVVCFANHAAGDRSRRFFVAPESLARAAGVARRAGLELLGIYHSHPGAPAIPSERDRAAAELFWSYVIVSPRADGTVSMRSWRLASDRQRFAEERLSFGPPTSAETTDRRAQRR